MKRIVYTRPDGGTSIVIPAPSARKTYEKLRAVLPPELAVSMVDETEDEFVERIRQKAVPADATNVRIVDESEIPSDRTFRNAWKADLTVDMPKARELKRDHLRQLRKPLMEALDVAYMRADEKGDIIAKADIAEKKQALRDVTADPAIEAAKTPKELKAVMPLALRERA